MQPGRDVWWNDFVEGAEAYCAPEKMDAEDMLFLLYTSGSTGKPKGIVHTTGGYLTGVYATDQVGLRPPRHRRVLVHRRHRLGHRSLLRRVRPPRQRRHHRDVRGHAGLSRQGSLLAHRREARGHHLLHGADGHPHVHAVGRGVSQALRPLEPAPPGQRRGADQSRGLGVVLEGDRRGALPRRRHVVADRDRPHPDHAAARHDDAQAGLGHPAVPRRRRRGGQRQGRAVEGRLPDPQEALARYAPRDLPRPEALRGPVLEPLSRALLHR